MSVHLQVLACTVMGVIGQGSHLPSYGSDFALPPYEEKPGCAKNTTKNWCIQDDDYPVYDLVYALDQHYEAVLALYQDTVVNTMNSVDTLSKLEQETYLCPTTTSYAQPLRAVNADGKWRVIVNKVESYGYKFDQHVRIEECEVDQHTPCPLVPSCYDSKCLQKNVFHRFLVYDPYDYYFPFALESFKLPASCACLVGAFLG